MYDTCTVMAKLEWTPQHFAILSINPSLNSIVYNNEVDQPKLKNSTDYIHMKFPSI